MCCALWRSRLAFSGRDLACLVLRRHLVSPVFGDDEQHDVAEFFKELLRSMAAREVHLRPSLPVTFVEHVFGWILERRRRCAECGRCCAPEFESGTVLALPLPVDGSSGSVTPTELYMRFCGPIFLDGAAALRCEHCGRCTKHVEQRRICRSPKVLAVHFQRSVGAEGQQVLRRAIDLEFEVVWPQLPSMELHSVVYHRGVDATKGQYTAAARCVQKRFWRFEDDRLCREVVGDVSKLLPTQIVMAFYEAVSGAPLSSPWGRGAAGGPRDVGAGGLPGADSGLSWIVAVCFCAS